MSNLEILSTKQVFDEYRKKIFLVHQGKQIASASIVTAIVEVGKLCIEAKEYKERINIKNKEKLWKEFSENLPVSKSTISKYISVSQNSFIRLKKNHKSLPPSVYSLYELSKLPSNRLEKLVEKNKIHSDIGRSELNLLLGNQKKSKLIDDKSKDIEFMVLKISGKKWEDKLEKIQKELIEFLNRKGISFEFSSKLKKRERSELSHSKKIQKYMNSRMRKYFKEQLIVFVNSSLNGKNLGNVKSLPKKLKLLKINEDEVDYKNNHDIDELKDQFINVGLGSKDDWNNHLSIVMGDSYEKFPPPLNVLNKKNEVTDLKLIQSLKIKSIKRNFDGFKI